MFVPARLILAAAVALTGVAWAAAGAEQSAAVPVRLKRLWPLEQRGWLSADMHTHARRIPLNMLRAEDVNVVTRTFYSSQKPYVTSIDRADSDALHLSAENQT
jgi:hypothetical protein